jgi:hypothetical protein
MSRFFGSLMVVSLLLAGCFSLSSPLSEPDAATHDGATDAAKPDSTTDGDHPSDADDADVTDPRHPVIPCGTLVYQCGDGRDNDDDGLVDSDDPDCVGPCDNNEESFYLDLAGSTGDETSCLGDCYFDENRSSGGGDCEWDLRCDPLEPGAGRLHSCAYVGEGNDVGSYGCADHFDDHLGQRENCEPNCLWRVPNGCDCFGCCFFPTEEDPDRHVLIGRHVLVGDGDGVIVDCTYEEATKEASPSCAACTPVPSCGNDCGPCEVCLGRRTPPESCAQEEIAGRCGAEAQVCGLPGDEPCEAGFYCLTGCCVQFVFTE